MQPEVVLDAEAWFNRALALEGLHLWHDAIQAWNAHLKIDPRSGWAREARLRETRLARRPKSRLLGSFELRTSHRECRPQRSSQNDSRIPLAGLQSGGTRTIELSPMTRYARLLEGAPAVESNPRRDTSRLLSRSRASLSQGR